MSLKNLIPNCGEIVVTSTSTKGGSRKFEKEGREPFQSQSHVDRSRLEAIPRRNNILFCLDAFRGTLEVKFGTKTF